MQKNKNLVDIIFQEYSATFKVQNTKQMVPRIQINAIGDRKGEAYRASYEAGLVTLEADNYKAAIYGLSQLTIGVLSGHLPECLGNHKPKFPLRPLWLPCYAHVETPRRILEMGYNAVVVGSHPSLIQTDSEKIPHLCQELQSHGIKVIYNLKIPKSEGVTTCPLDPMHQERIKKEVAALFNEQASHYPDAIFWESNILSKDFHQHSAAVEATTLDLLRAELSLLEKCVTRKTELIYYLPSEDLKGAVKQTKSLDNLCHFADKQTTIAFSATAGNPWDDHQPLHPFWESLRTQIEAIKTPLLPIINAGGINTGEGLWPTPPFEKIDRMLTRLTRHHFSGAIILAGTLPAKGSFNDCHLWSTGKALWIEGINADIIIETWIKAYHSHATEEALKTLKMARHIALQIKALSLLNSIDEVRKKAEHLLLETQLLSNLIVSHNKRKGPSLSDYMRYFLRDVRKLILFELQEKNISALSLMNNEDVLESFWTLASRQPGDQYKIKRLVAPVCNESDPIMASIFHENRL